MIGDCNTCKHYEGDCGHHFVDSNNHIHFDCPDEACCDKCGNCAFFERKKQKKSPRVPIDRIKRLIEETDNKLQIAKAYSMDLRYIRGIYDVLELIDNMIKEYGE